MRGRRRIERSDGFAHCPFCGKDCKTLKKMDAHSPTCDKAPDWARTSDKGPLGVLGREGG